MNYIQCPKCEGTGKIIDPRSFAADMRKFRENSGLSLRFVATQMDIAPPHLSDMERGNRGWTEQRIEQFSKICREKGTRKRA